MKKEAEITHGRYYRLQLARNFGFTREHTLILKRLNAQMVLIKMSGPKNAALTPEQRQHLATQVTIHDVINENALYGNY